MSIQAKTYRDMASLCRGWRDSQGEVSTDIVRAGKLGCAEAVIGQAISDLERGWPTEDVLRYLRRAHDEITLSPEAYVAAKEAQANEYDRKADAIEAAAGMAHP